MMTMPSERHPLSNFVHSPPIVNAHWRPRPLDDRGHDTGASLKRYRSTLYDSRWLIAFITTVITIIAVMYVLVASPVYEANMMIHVEEDDQTASKNVMKEALSLHETKLAATAEMALLRSRLVVGRAVDNLQFFVDVQPKHFPVVAFWPARHNAGILSKPGILGYGGYVWGSEQAEISLFNVPDALLNREFVVTAQGQQRFRISGGGQRIVFDGLVGNRYIVQTPDGPIDIRIDSMQASAGAIFHLKRRSRFDTIAAIQRAMEITEQGSRSGMIEVRLQGEDPRKITALLTELGRVYMNQNLARSTEETEKSLAFLYRQLAATKHQLDESETRYNQFRNQHGTVDLQEEARTTIQQSVAAHNRRVDLMQKKTELMGRFTEDHPIVSALDRQRKEIDGEIDEIALRIKALPTLEQDDARLTRDIKVKNESYSALSNAVQQLSLMSAGRVSNVRMIDAPIVPENPMKPNRVLIVFLAMITGLFLGTLGAFIRKALRSGIDDPSAIERLLQARVIYATIPHSISQDKLGRKAREGVSLPLLAQMMPEDPAIESLRIFRAALLFSMPHLKNNIVMLTGPTRHLGKSFIAANFAAVVAASGKRVLLIDADLRNGGLHRYFGVPREPGLSNAISGSMRAEDAIRHSVIDNLDFMGTGIFPPNRSEFLLHHNFRNLLETVSQHYDLVLVDPAPILSFADALIIGPHAGSVFIVARSGLTTEVELNESITRLNHAGISPQGVLFNDTAQRLNLVPSFSGSGENARLGCAY